ncbi:MAG: hypothetical protein ACI84C_002790 [Flavobacteriales bacterium]|jgi:hypothetical protein
MDYLKETISTMSDEERKEFRVFMQRQRVKSERKDLALFKILLSKEEYKPREITQMLYGKPNLNAYHTLRKRLTRELLDFTMLKSMDEDNTSYSTILGMIAMSRRLLDKNRPDIARRYLEKAEALANSTESYDLLDNILNLQIKHAHELDLDVEQIIKHWKLFREEAEIDEKVNLAYGLIRQRLNHIKRTGEPQHLLTITTNALKELDLDETRVMRPALMYMLVSMTRSAIIATKNYVLFDSYVCNIYDQLIERDAFSKKNHIYHLWFLYMIAHVKYRNRDFEKSRKYVNALNGHMSHYGNMHFNRFYPRSVLLDAAVYSYMNENGKSIHILEEALTNPQLNLTVEDRCNMTLNLAVYHFQGENYREANKLLRDIGHTDKWLEKRVGIEWRFKKNLIEIIVQVEMENTEIALARISSIDRYYKSFFKNEMYQRARIFLGFIKQVIEKPDSIVTEDFAQHVNQTIVRLPGDKEDIQAITFYCWLKSKMLRKSYYPVLIETVHSFGRKEVIT